MKKRIGVITLYYNNSNYGGLLQAYALVKALENIGVSAEQIAYNRSKDKSPVILSRKKRFKEYPVLYVKRYIQNRIQGFYYNLNYKSKQVALIGKFKERESAFELFQERIPHTQAVDCNSVKDLNETFDGFMCGSDQVWNPEQLRDAYLLKFANKDKIKCAYAASFGRDELSDYELSYIANAILPFDAISVREVHGCEMLEKKLGKEIKWVVDPTLLLSTEDWDEVIEPYSIEEPYILNYLLGDSVSQRNAVRKFAKDKGMSIASFPHIQGKYRRCDEGFADIDLYNVNPAQFLFLIKNARYIITDSFHACVFSILFKKNFVVFEREDGVQQKKMNSRISSLLSLTNLEGQLVSEKTLCEIQDVKFDCNNELNKRKEISYDFLRNVLQSN